MRRAWLAMGAAVLGSPAAAAEPALTYAVRGDAIALSLTGQAGDPSRGRDLVGDRRRGLCLLCHQGPFPDPHLQGELAPDLRGAGSRLSEGQLRLRIVDMKAINPSSIMPSYYRTTGLNRVAPAWSGRPVLSGQEIEDVVAYLVTLKD